MADEIAVKLGGFDAMNRALLAATKEIRTKAVRSALRKAGNVIKKAAQQAAPVLQVPTKTRKSGTVRKAITVRFSKFARRAGNEMFFIGVRPLRGSHQKRLGKAGARNPNDPFYWRFQEFGYTAVGSKKIAGGKRSRERERKKRVSTGKARWIEGKHFLRDSANNSASLAVDVFMASVVPQIEKLDAKGRNVR